LDKNWNFIVWKTKNKKNLTFDSKNSIINPMNKILVTGGLEFTGSNLIRLLLKIKCI
tara:strand:- start:74 stop:244 length:171 start_codon:yes stop_codon:yes gene_type:complete